MMITKVTYVSWVLRKTLFEDYFLTFVLTIVFFFLQGYLEQRHNHTIWYINILFFCLNVGCESYSNTFNS